MTIFSWQQIYDHYYYHRNATGIFTAEANTNCDFESINFHLALAAFSETSTVVFKHAHFPSVSFQWWSFQFLTKYYISLMLLQLHSYKISFLPLEYTM